MNLLGLRMGASAIQWYNLDLNLIIQYGLSVFFSISSSPFSVPVKWKTSVVRTISVPTLGNLVKGTLFLADSTRPKPEDVFVAVVTFAEWHLPSDILLDQGHSILPPATSKKHFWRSCFAECWRCKQICDLKSEEHLLEYCASMVGESVFVLRAIQRSNDQRCRDFWASSRWALHLCW